MSLRFGVGVLGLSLLASSNACGHSLRQLRTADVYFERCYGGERDERYSDAERRDCWEAWLAHYTAEQSDERVSYARERLILLDPDRRAMIELSTGEAEAELEAEAEAELEAELEESEAVSETGEIPREPVPEVVLTDAHEGEDAEADHAGPHHRPTLPRSSTAHCDTTCLPPWQACVDACEDRDRSCYGACRQSYRICSAACY